MCCIFINYAFYSVFVDSQSVVKIILSLLQNLKRKGHITELNKEKGIRKRLGNREMKRYMIFVATIFIVPVMILVGSILHIDVPVDLYGIVPENQKPLLTAEGIFDGEFQEDFDNWYKESHPFRALFVKIHNQILYCMNSCLLSGDIVVGKDGWLYSKEYISCSFEEISEDMKKRYDEYVRKVKLLQDNLEASGKKFVYIISPSKVEMYPEFLPNRFHGIMETKDQIKNNYEYFLEKLKTENVNLVDAKTILLNETGDIPFFTKTGIHWNYYAAAICAKEILKQLGDYKHILVEEIKRDTPFGAEQDIYLLSNVFKGVADKEYFGGTLVCDSFGEAGTQKVFEMGTSFSVELASIFCTEGNYIWEEMIRYQYFVNKTIYKNGMPPEGRAGDEIVKEHIKDEIIAADVILIENNDSYVPESHFEFVNNALKYSEEIRRK